MCHTHSLLMKNKIYIGNLKLNRLHHYIYSIFNFFQFRCLDIYFFQDKMFHGYNPIISWNKALYIYVYCISLYRGLLGFQRNSTRFRAMEFLFGNHTSRTRRTYLQVSLPFKFCVHNFLRI